MLDEVPEMGTMLKETAMRVISRKTLKSFWEMHRRAEKPLRAWFHEAKLAHWKNYQEIKNDFPAADVIPGNRVVFDIKGNDYRIVIKIHYNTGVAFIRFVGTHAEYDHINAETI
jgi:mRNA interferase HigB